MLSKWKQICFKLQLPMKIYDKTGEVSEANCNSNKTYKSNIEFSQYHYTWLAGCSPSSMIFLTFCYIEIYWNSVETRRKK